MAEMLIGVHMTIIVNGILDLPIMGHITMMTVDLMAMNSLVVGRLMHGLLDHKVQVRNVVLNVGQGRVLDLISTLMVVRVLHNVNRAVLCVVIIIVIVVRIVVVTIIVFMTIIIDLSVLLRMIPGVFDGLGKTVATIGIIELIVRCFVESSSLAMFFVLELFVVRILEMMILMIISLTMVRREVHVVLVMLMLHDGVMVELLLVLAELINLFPVTLLRLLLI